MNKLLPGRDYSRSLYSGLVTEGILTEDMDWRTTDPSDEVTSISYDRLRIMSLPTFCYAAISTVAIPELRLLKMGGWHSFAKTRDTHWVGSLRQCAFRFQSRPVENW